MANVVGLEARCSPSATRCSPFKVSIEIYLKATGILGDQTCMSDAPTDGIDDTRGLIRDTIRKGI